MSKKFIYGIAEVRFKKKGGTTKEKVGYIEKGSRTYTFTEYHKTAND